MEAFPNVKKPSSDELVTLARERAAEKKIEFHVALNEIRRELPALAEEARQEALLGPSADIEAIPGSFASRPHSWELHKKARARAAEKQIPFSMARQEIESEEPELAAKARAEGGLDIREIKMLPDGTEMIICSTELGRTSDPAGLLASVAGNRSRHSHVEYHIALSEVRRTYPRLARAADRQVMGVDPFRPGRD